MKQTVGRMFSSLANVKSFSHSECQEIKRQNPHAACQVLWTTLFASAFTANPGALCPLGSAGRSEQCG
jgi:hypothetical protein